MELRYPIVAEIEEITDDVMDDVMDRMELLGFMPRFGRANLYPYAGFVDAFYEETGTYPTHILFTDENVDAEADGLSVELCGADELAEAQKALDDIHYIEIDELVERIGKWESGR